MFQRMLVAALLALLLAGCGFHLRGSVPLEWHLGKVYIAPGPAVASILANQLQLNGVTVVGNPAQADAIITITHENYDRRVLSVNPRTGKVTEYEISIHVGVQATRPDGILLFSDDSIQLQRDQTFEESAALSKFQAQTIIERDLRTDAADVVMRRLQSATGKPLAPDARTAPTTP
jgi:LPS-assembly lipoprotein